MHHLKEVQKYGQSIWLDFISRSLITSGKLKQLVDEGLRGVTSNPTIFNKAISQSQDYAKDLDRILGEEPGIDTKTFYERLAIEDIRMAADMLRPIYEETGGGDGFISLEASPYLAYDTPGTIAEVWHLWQLVDRPNVLIKVPATSESLPAIESFIAEGININITLLFSIKHYEAVAQAYIRGVARNPKPERVASVASVFVSRVDTYVDKQLEKIGTKAALALRGKVAVANAKLVYRRFREVFYGEDFVAQRKRGARVQRLVWGSTSTKNPAYSDLLYVENLIGPDTVNTIPMETLDAFRDHGKIRPALAEGLEEAEQVLANLKRVGVNLDEITEELQRDGVKAFADAFDELFTTLEKKR